VYIDCNWNPCPVATKGDVPVAIGTSNPITIKILI
jgi:hypothetical protein